MQTKHIAAANNWDQQARVIVHYPHHPASKTSYVRDLETDTDTLTGPARWLAEHVPPELWSARSATDPARRVLCYDGRTQTEARTAERGAEWAASAHRAYSDGAEPVSTEWLFPRAAIAETGPAYWRRAADEMRARGAVRVRVGAAELTL
jgi:hypothetical protein